MTSKPPLATFTALALIALAAGRAAAADGPSEDLRQELKGLPLRIVFESFYDGHWGLKSIRADGSDPAVLAKTPGVSELYPHVSPDGTKLCYLVDEGEGAKKSRNVYCRNLDGTGRKLVATNGRDPCWTSDGSAIVYLKGEIEAFTLKDFASRGVATYDLATRRHRVHPNTELAHLYNICCSTDDRWFIATVHAGMGFRHAILAIEAGGQGVFDLHLPGCRPDVSRDGKRIAWGAGDCELRVADLDFSQGKPRVANSRTIVTSREPIHIYHVDWSPDGKYLAFSRGPKHQGLGYPPEMIGVKAEGWDICVADAAKPERWVALTRDGLSNKEPDWAPLPAKGP